MKIKSARRVHPHPSPGGFTPVAAFSLEPMEGVLIFDCSVVRARDGRLLVYGPPSKHGGPLVNLAPAQRAEVLKLVTDELGIDDAKRNTSA